MKTKVFIITLSLGLLLLTGFLLVATGAQAQETVVTPAEVHVLHSVADNDVGVFVFSSNVKNQPDETCAFGQILIFGSEAGNVPLLASLGKDPNGSVINGSVVADSKRTLNVLSGSDAKWVAFNTTCGSNGGDFGAKALLNRIKGLEDNESVTLPALYFESFPWPN